MIRRTIREWQHIPYGLGESAIPQAHADRIARVARSSVFAGRRGEGVLEHGRKSLRARGVVGIVATSGCQLEILPKTEGADDEGVSDATLRQRLIHMLALVHDLPIDIGSMARLGWQQDSVLEHLIAIFCDRLASALRQGMPRHYIGHEADLPALRGRLDVTRQFRVHAVAPQKMACRFDSLSHDIALNQVMRAAITKLSRLTRSSDNQRTLRELGFAYIDVAEIPSPILPWDEIVLDRTNRRWRDLLSLARLFLSDRYQETSSGESDGYALLFEMNVLFERYVARILSRALAGTGLRLSAQGGHRDCVYEGDRGRFRTRPDLIIKQEERVVLIVDTKWKRIARRVDDKKQGISQSDIYQLMAYGQLYHCPNVMLLYPHHGGLPPDPVLAQYAIAAPDAQESLFVATLDLDRSAREQGEALRQFVRHCMTG